VQKSKAHVKTNGLGRVIRRGQFGWNFEKAAREPPDRIIGLEGLFPPGMASA
jgi:hypothetical protein